MKVEARTLKIGDIATRHCGCRYRRVWYRADIETVSRAVRSRMIPAENVSLCKTHSQPEVWALIDTEVVDVDPLANELQEQFSESRGEEA